MLQTLRTSLLAMLILFVPLAAIQAAETRTVVLDVPGMTCRFCPITVRKALEKVPGVIEAQSDFASKTATVTFDPEKTSVADLVSAVKNAGYEAIPRAGAKDDDCRDAGGRATQEAKTEGRGTRKGEGHE